MHRTSDMLARATVIRWVRPLDHEAPISRGMLHRACQTMPERTDHDGTLVVALVVAVSIVVRLKSLLPMVLIIVPSEHFVYMCRSST